MSSAGVDLVVNVFERTYRDVLRPGWFDALAASMPHPFARRVVLVNNTDDPDHARSLAQKRIAAGEITHVHFVADHIDDALTRTGLTHRSLGSVPYYSDWALAALVLPGSPYVLHWDADLTLRQPCDWVTPSLELLATAPDVVVANPSWNDAEARAEARELRGDFAVGYGFSDWAFLVHRDTFLDQRWRGPVVPATYRYPLAHVAPIFEQRADSWMRRTRKLRASYLPAVIVSGRAAGGYPTTTRTQRLRRRVQAKVLDVGRRLLPANPLTAPYPQQQPQR